MKIKKNLKYAEFEYDEESKSFTIIDTEHGGVVELNKVYSFAFMRFVIRMAQRNWLRKIPKKTAVVGAPPLEETAEFIFEDCAIKESCSLPLLQE